MTNVFVHLRCPDNNDNKQNDSHLIDKNKNKY